MVVRVRLEAKVWEAGHFGVTIQTQQPHALIEGQRVVLYDVVSAEDLEERAAEVGWWSEIADSSGVYRVTVEEDEDGDLAYSSTKLSDADADPVAAYLRELWEQMIPAKSTDDFVRVRAGIWPGANAWVAENPDHGDRSYGPMPDAAVAKFRASLEPQEQPVGEMSEPDLLYEATGGHSCTDTWTRMADGKVQLRIYWSPDGETFLGDTFRECLEAAVRRVRERGLG